MVVCPKSGNGFGGRVSRCPDMKRGIVWLGEQACMALLRPGTGYLHVAT